MRLIKAVAGGGIIIGSILVLSFGLAMLDSVPFTAWLHAVGFAGCILASFTTWIVVAYTGWRLLTGEPHDDYSRLP